MENFIVYVEKRPGFDVEAKRVQGELVNFLGLKNIENVRVLNRYDASGMSQEVYKKALKTVFSEPQCDRVYEEVLPQAQGFIFMTSFLRGQYDQRADSCVQCIKTIDSHAIPVVKASKVYMIEGQLEEKDKERIKNHLINPIESEEVALDATHLLDATYPIPEDVKVLEGFNNYTKEELETFRKANGLAMSLEDLAYFQSYFQSEKRNPSFTELKVVDTYWSDHCRHTTFMTELTDITIEEGALSKPVQEAYTLYQNMRDKLYTQKSKKVSLMDMATIIVKDLKAEGGLKEMVESDEINACTLEKAIEVDGNMEDYLVLFKNETHNHPTEIEPFGGAATCLGGAIRDPLSGRSYVYQAMRVTGAGDVTAPMDETIPGKLPQRKISQTATNGYSSYGNQIGLATGEVKEYYHPGYVAKRLEVGAVVGAVKSDAVRREEPVAGDVIILLGGATGRDGCGGATGSSKEHTEDSLMQCGSEVQKGNPVEERKLQRIFRNPEFSKTIKRCNDFGAGGVCVAIGEIAEGLIIDLDQVPVKYMGLDGTELAISESQERMAIAIEACDVEKVIALCEAENLNAVQVGTVTEEKRLIMKWRGKEIVNINRVFLDSAGVTQQREAHVAAPNWCEDTRSLTKENVMNTLSDLNVASQKGLGLQFDSTIGARSVLMPYGGKNQLTKEVGMVAKIPVISGETTAATYMTHGFDPYLAEQSPFHGSLYAVVESIAKLVALGANYKDTYLSFQEYFERLGEDKTKWGKPVAALLGTLVAQRALGVAAIGGKDSMSGTFENLNVPPTLISFTCNIGDARNCVSGSFKAAGNKVVYIHIPVGEDKVPNFEVMKEVYDSVHSLATAKQIASSYAIGKGGLVAALSQMAIGNDLGAKVSLESLQVGAFEAAYGDLVLEVTPEVAATLPENFVVIGETIKESNLTIDDVTVALNEVKATLEAPLADVFKTEVENEVDGKDATYSEAPRIYTAKNKIAVPKVVIPVFPGTNCEDDTKRAFMAAGAEVEQVLFLNRTPEAIEDSLNRMANAIDKAQILAFPGGFSAGDEPDGSAKFIAAAFRNERLQEAVMKHLYEQDGLALGICNGFQVLVKLGLLPYGEICEMDENKPTLTYNTIGKHISLMAKTKITSVQSPWLSHVNVGEQYEIPLSHGEGRFVAPQAVLDELVKNGQIFSQYVDASGFPSKAGSVNVNGSLYNIEGIVSKDGRIIGKMGHSERVGECVHINIPGNKDQQLFKSGVEYFK